MSEQRKNKLGTQTIIWCYKSDIAAFETILRRAGIDWQHKVLAKSPAHVLLKAIARGEVAVIPLGDEDLEQSIRVMSRVRQTMRTIDPTLASPLYRIHTGLTLCRQLRKAYKESSEEYRTEVEDDPQV